MTNLTKDNFDIEVAKASGLVVIDLYATWCGPCRMLAPILEELEGEYPEVKFCKVDVDAERELAMAFKVESIPMIAFVKNDVFVDFSVGYVPKASLVALIEKYKGN